MDASYPHLDPGLAHPEARTVSPEVIETLLRKELRDDLASLTSLPVTYLVNTHHHLYQSLTRAVPGGQDALLFGWLQTLYPIWSRFGPEEMYISAQAGLAELALSGCTMTRSRSSGAGSSRSATMMG